MKTPIKRVASAIAIAVAGAFMLTGCGAEAIVGGDNYACVYDKNDKLVKQIPPNSEAYRLDAEETVVYIPSSDRFYNVTFDDTTRDALAPKSYDRAFASGNVPMHVEGKMRFRFNLTKACEWYAKHGRRNLAGASDLGFNARGAEQQTAPWLRFLAENHGEEMNSTTTEILPNYAWPAMVYNYPVNAGEDGVVPAGQKPEEPTRDKLGRELGEKFTVNLEKALGGEYFCGVVETAGAKEDDCPPITFKVLNVKTQNEALMTQRQALEDTRQQIQTAEEQNKLQKTNQATQLEAEVNKQRLLEEQAKTAEIQARIDTAKCRQLGSVGLDCDGKRPGIYQGVPQPAPAG